MKQLIVMIERESPRLKPGYIKTKEESHNAESKT